MLDVCTRNALELLATRIIILSRQSEVENEELHIANQIIELQLPREELVFCTDNINRMRVCPERDIFDFNGNYKNEKNRSKKT